MLYNLGDKFYFMGMDTEVRFVNGKNAWLFPIEDSQEYPKCVALAMINKKGVDKKGNKATPIIKAECLAV